MWCSTHNLSVEKHFSKIWIVVLLLRLREEPDAEIVVYSETVESQVIRNLKYKTIAKRVVNQNT